MGTTVETPALDMPGLDVPRLLGNCPVTALRAAWGEMDALEAVAVDEEVLAICTRRAESVTRIMAVQRDFETELGALLAPPDPAAPIPTSDKPIRDISTSDSSASDSSASDGPGLIALQSEVDILSARVAELEGKPERAAELPAARAALAEAQARLAEAKRNAGEIPSQGEVAHTGAEPNPAEQGPNTAPDPVVVDRRPDQPPGTGNLTGTIRQLVSDAQVSLPEETLATETLAWTVIYTVRAGEGPWKAQVLGEGSRAVMLPPLTDAGEPRVEWQSFAEGPYLLGEGDALPGDPEGRIVAEITADGVMARPEMAVAEAVTPLIWHQGADPMAPGRADWIVTKIEPEQSGQ